MNEDELKEGEGQAEMPKPNYDADPNVKARRRAAKRSDNRNKGKDLDEGIVAEAKAEEPAAEEMPTSPEVEGEEGGIVAEAKEEEAMVEAASDDKAEGESEAPAEVPAAEEPTAESEMEPPAEEKAEKAAEPMTEEVGEYAAPEGPAHDELIDQYHEALAFGDLETAKALYKQLQDHRFRENTHRAKSEAQAEQEVKAYVAAATELAAKYPELAEDGLPATKVMALSDVYRQEGMSAADALRKAVADLYPEPSAEVPAPEAPMEPAPEAPAEPEMAAEEPAAPAEEEGMIPDMTERKAAKRSIPAMPSASARNEPAPPPKAPTRSDAIQQMKEKRGQA